ncbi:MULTISPECIES: SDR family oxidoreductase [Paraburkholderia]|uniref:NAD(P)-dependent dehydrogenase (Short-subunit alcohol dehydrogenase family) n=1 Tax=Paraburkholderia tropica TaxID=92647 RepID=A0ABX5MXF0_9BURK|nr:SDR family oxidoreductase [Paraburkholderia tropica]MBB3003364.1 NAD(P)-dependent dehydrogenase (short-subunit alcohol dehydrogenase family) [Paraburkholderia tropica]MBB6322380.1 NAD(P)-dependent dehydrogenase (short-subunit alcohol dehydrogenase family) [Paraburkholderia tropica]MDE1140064.1 SDR family oxidoreductase [Paraburkholderia tropica]PXX17999.1 NAD(P)-dependent dehydrogenase (short-subunit alcohol dehydrogenase family) [Paraburkholderia tropica]PZW85981.1 NAD(P)-dependent dehydro
MTAQLKGRRVVIVGGTSGFGFEVARMARDAGAQVVITGRDAQRRDAALAALATPQNTVSALALDIADEAALADFFARIEPFDHLVSMAGGAMGGGFLEAPLETIRQAVEEKFYANLRLARHAAPRLREGGSLVFTAGSGGRAHNASGAIVGNDAIRTLVEGLAVELAPRARVNAVAPTWTRTPLWRNLPASDVDAIEQRFTSLIPLGRTAKVEEVAAAYLFLIGNGFVTGQTIAVDGGVTLVS